MQQAAIYNETDTVDDKKFYVSEKGTLPHVGDEVEVLNFHNGHVLQCQVVSLLGRTLEYTVKLQQPQSILTNQSS